MKLIWRYAEPIVLNCTVSTGVVYVDIHLGSINVEGVLEQAEDNVVERGDDNGRLDLVDDVFGELPNGHGTRCVIVGYRVEAGIGDVEEQRDCRSEAGNDVPMFRVQGLAESTWESGR